MLWFVGIGVSGPDSISIETQKVLENANTVYLEQFTSPISKSDLNKFKKLTKGEFKIAKRWMVEDGSEILKNAKKKKVVLLAYGDPYIATTHIELRTRAIQEKIKTKTIHAASAVTSLIGECGLHYYKVGRIATIMGDMKSMTTPYYVIYKNFIEGNHTVLLLEYNQDKDFFLKPKEALNGIIATEKEQKRNVVNSSTFAIVASRIGFKNQSIVAGKISSLKKIDFGKPPHTIVIPGALHFTESDALKLLAKCTDAPFDNSSMFKKISKQMLEKYV
ncbi:MAG: diphthine synthase, partial [Nitrosopumilaceae archaeon]